MTTATTVERTARMAVLSWHEPGARPQNVFTHLRHRRQDALGPWVGKPSKAWQTDDLGNDLRLSTFEASLERCQALVDRVVDSGTLEIEGSEIDYTLESHPRRHWAYRRRLQVDAAVLSPFSRHSAEITEYWTLAAEPRKRWMEMMASHEDEFRTKLSRLGFPLHRRVERTGNLIIARAEDTISCSLGRLPRQHTEISRRCRRTAAGINIALRYGPVTAATTCFCERYPVTLGRTAIDLTTDVDRIGFSVCRTFDGQCIDMKESVLVKEISVRVNFDAAPLLHLRDPRGRQIHTVKRSGVDSPIDVRLEKNGAELDKGIRRLWLDRQFHEREAAARREHNLVRFEPDEFTQAAGYFISLLHRGSDSKKPVYFADRYFMNYIKERRGHKLYLDMFAAATADRPLYILCADKETTRSAPWWTSYPKYLTKHIHVRSFLRRGDKMPGFHDRFLITPEEETAITHSFRGWVTDGVTFASLPYSVYRAEAERLWNMDIGSTTTPLVVREIA